MTRLTDAIGGCLKVVVVVVVVAVVVVVVVMMMHAIIFHFLTLSHFAPFYRPISKQPPCALRMLALTWCVLCMCDLHRDL